MEKKEAEEEYKTNLKGEEKIREIVTLVRQDMDCYEIFQDSIYSKFPHLEKLCELALNMYTTGLAQRESSKKIEIKQFHKNLFDHMLKICFVYPKMFTQIDRYELFQSLEIIDKNWEMFIISCLQFKFEISLLTHENLKEHHHSPVKKTLKIKIPFNE